MTPSDPILSSIIALWATLPVQVRYQVAELCFGAAMPEEDVESA